MKKGQEYECTIERVDFPNKGIAFVEGEKVTIKDTLPGQKVRFMVSKKRTGSAEGKLREIIESSPIESRTPACPHFGICGGCTYQKLAYEDQLRIKETQVKKLLDAVITSPYDFTGITASPSEWEYRNKMEFSFGDICKGGELALGLHKKGSFYDILPINGCKIVNEDYNLILDTTLNFCRERDMTYYHKMSHEGYLRHLLVRRAATTGDILINLITAPGYTGSETEAEMLDCWKEMLLSLPLSGKIAGILHTINSSPADAVNADSVEILYGTDIIYEELLGLKFKVSTFSFFQTNSYGAERLYSIVRGYVGETKDKVIYDLYSGTGTIAQILAPVAREVIGVEIVEEAVDAARENAELNKLSNCTFIAGDVLKQLDNIEVLPDIIVLDPPRDGINPKALEKIIAYGVQNMVYVSCKPTSLARDLVLLQEGGYEVKEVRCCDMFPQTPHVETVVLLSNKKIDGHISIDSDIMVYKQ